MRSENPASRPELPDPMRRRTVLTGALSAAPLGALAACGPTDGGGDPTSASGASDGGGESASHAAGASPSTDAAAEREGSLTLEQAAGQLVLVGATPSSGLPEALAGHGAGGIFLLDVWRSAEDVRGIIEQARTASGGADGPTGGIPPLITVDQEGGQVRMLRDGAGRRTESAAALGAQGPEAVRAAYEQIGQDLAALGIAVDLAPVADVVDPAMGRDNDPVGGLERGFGTEPEAVSSCVREAVDALAASGIAATLKHFPGLGRVDANTDTSAEGVQDDRTAADDPFLAPFRAGIEAGAGIVMVAGATYSRIDPAGPAMFSSAVVTDLLRGSLGFEGLVMTDDIGVATAIQSVPVGERATRLLEAGGDVVLTADPGLAGELIEAIVGWAGEAPGNEARVRESAARMLRVKESLGLLG